jgi:hypothetical protein
MLLKGKQPGIPEIRPPQIQFRKASRMGFLNRMPEKKRHASQTMEAAV